MPGSGDLYAAALHLLDHANQALATTPGGAIPRAFVTTCNPAFDCAPQLTVHAAQIREADTSPGPGASLDPFARAQMGTVFLATLVTTILRCVPTHLGDRPPSPAQITAASVTTYADAWAVWEWFHHRHRIGVLFQGMPCRPVAIGAATCINDQGGTGGWQVPLEVQIDGYVP